MNHGALFMEQGTMDEKNANFKKARYLYLRNAIFVRRIEHSRLGRRTAVEGQRL